jgi:hypothetical protein
MTRNTGVGVGLISKGLVLLLSAYLSNRDDY